MGPIRTLIREILSPSAGGAATVPTLPTEPGSVPPVMPTQTPTPATDSWQVRYAPLIRKVLAWAVAAVVGALLARLGIPPEVIPVPAPMVDPLDGVPFNYEGARYEGGAEGVEHAENNGQPWPQKRITYHLDYESAASVRPPISRDALAGEFRIAWNWWAEGIEIEPVEVTDPNAAMVRIKFGRIDGPSGTLAWSYLADGTMRPKDQLYDVNERWTAGPPASGLLSLRTVACHEIGHVLGLAHDDPQAPAVMRPMYTASIPREQARDYTRMIGIGYRKRDKAPAGPVDVLTFPVQAKTSDVIEAMEKAGFKVQK
jgi:hypothetical protein